MYIPEVDKGVGIGEFLKLGFGQDNLMIKGMGLHLKERYIMG